jgi:hypothetical protein
VPQDLALVSGNELRQRGSVAQAGTGDKTFIKLAQNLTSALIVDWPGEICNGRGF